LKGYLMSGTQTRTIRFLGLN